MQSKVKRYENKYPGSRIETVISLTGDGNGTAGPRYILSIANQFYDMRRDSLADFLNSASISQNIEDGLYNDFKDVLSKTDKGYKYTGPQSEYGESWSDLEKLVDRDINTQKKINLVEFSQDPPLNLENSYGVLMDEVAITNAENTKHILATYGASTCIIVAGYNPKIKAAFLAHYSHMCITQDLNQYLDMIKSEGSKIQIYLYGGYDDKDSRDCAGSIVKLIEGRSDTEIVFKELCQDSIGFVHLALDTKTGEIYQTFEIEKLDCGKDVDERMAIIKTKALIPDPIPLVLIFDGITQNQEQNNSWQQYCVNQNNQSMKKGI